MSDRLVEGLGQRILDWEGLDGRENAIGSLLYHIELIEMSWLYLDILVGPVPDFVEREFPHEDRDGEGRLSRVLGVPPAKPSGSAALEPPDLSRHVCGDVGGRVPPGPPVLRAQSLSASVNGLVAVNIRRVKRASDG